MKNNNKQQGSFYLYELYQPAVVSENYNFTLYSLRMNLSCIARTAKIYDLLYIYVQYDLLFAIADYH